MSVQFIIDHPLPICPPMSVQFITDHPLPVYPPMSVQFIIDHPLPICPPMSVQFITGKCYMLLCLVSSGMIQLSMMILFSSVL